MTQPTPQAALQLLIELNEPVTFYDAVQWLRTLEPGSLLPDDLVASMIQLYESPHATKGAQEVLGDFLRLYATRLQAERNLGNRQVGRKDNGKTARVRLGGTLTIVLYESDKANVYDVWDVEKLAGPAIIDSPTPGTFVLQFNAPGKVWLTLRQKTAAAQQKNRTKASTFDLMIVVED